MWQLRQALAAAAGGEERKRRGGEEEEEEEEIACSSKHPAEFEKNEAERSTLRGPSSVVRFLYCCLVVILSDSEPLGVGGT